MKYHPDKNNGNQEAAAMSKKINEAYEILGDEQKRQEYDQSKNNPFMRMNSNGGMETNMDDILNMFFGAAGNPFGMGGIPGMPMGQKSHISWWSDGRIPTSYVQTNSYYKKFNYRYGTSVIRNNHSYRYRTLGHGKWYKVT